jgi:flagellar M-ring protein FliF
LIQQVQSFWEELDARRRVIGLLTVVAILAAVIGIGRLATQPSMALLYSGLDPAAAGEVVAALEADGIPYEVQGGSIHVDAARRDETRLALAADGLPATGGTGYELLDRLSGFGTTSQMFDAAYWRAKEGELARTITASANVRAARVHIANPAPQPFARSTTASASVTVTMTRGGLGRDQAESMRYLVASAVAGLEPAAVAVLDSGTGVVLASGEAPSPLDPAMDPETRAETLKRNIEALLEARVGPGRAVVQVAVAADMEAQTIRERVIDPESRIAISSDVEASRESQTGTNPSVTVASNLPDGDVGGDASSSQRDASSSRERQNFEVSETTRERIIAPGQVRRITVAVLVDGIVAPNAEGTPVWAPRPAEELAQLRELVQSAIGYDEARGDAVSIQSLEFTAAAEQGTLVESGGNGFLARHGAMLAQLGVLAVIVLALIVFVLRPMLQRRETPLVAELAGPVPGEDAMRTIGGPSDDILALPLQTASKIDRLREVIASRSEDSAAVLRNWIEAPDSRRETAET